MIEAHPRADVQFIGSPDAGATGRTLNGDHPIPPSAVNARPRAPGADVTNVVDALAHVLFACKPEGTVEALTHRRDEYTDLQGATPATVVIEAARALSEVETAVVGAICHRLASGPRVG